jgi:hypothetical protein
VGEQSDENRSFEAVPGVAPPEPIHEPVLAIEVDGQAFEFCPDGRSGTHYTWLSGPNDDYGFTVSPTEGCSLDDHRRFIRNFLDQIDPATGFIGD